MCIFFLFFLLFIIGCVFKSLMKKIDLYIFFYDNFFKVWLVNKMFINKWNYMLFWMFFKEIIVFYVLGNCYFNKLKDMGSLGKKVIYWLDMEKCEFGFEGGKVVWVFYICYIV